MNQTERAIIMNTIFRLQGRSATSDQVQEALDGPLRLWLESWVIPPCWSC